LIPGFASDPPELLPPNDSELLTSPHPAISLVGIVKLDVVAYVLPFYFSVVLINVEVENPPNDNASLVVPHPLIPDLATFKAVVVA